MALTRSAIVNRTLLNRSIFRNRFVRLYFIKVVTYGKYKDIYDYSKVQVTFTNERIDFRKNKEGEKAQRSIARVREKIYRIVEANRGGFGKCKAVFFTLTDREQQTDIKIANKSIKALMRRLKNDLGYKPKYIIVPEKHKSGAIHYHGVFFNLPFIDIIHFKDDLWQKGYVDLQIPKKIKSVARYLSKYLTKDTFSSLPKNEKAYFCSRGLSRPSDSFTDCYPQDIIKTLELTKTRKYIKTKVICKN